MGCDIHSKTLIGTEPTIVQFTNERSYGLFGLLAGVRNYSDIPPITQPRDTPDWVNKYLGDHSYCYLTLDELNAVDWQGQVCDKRGYAEIAPNVYSGAVTLEEGVMRTRAEMAGYEFMLFLQLLNEEARGRERNDITFFFGFDS